ncbi:MAG: glycosyltransferase family 4 protein [Fibromonadaceae bacterium]|jgi:glycosyltransferase involved in cell wall biosynthesis|nr:glycosyltransferase family 4 protein [Fibromonadaceae bacterium]
MRILVLNYRDITHPMAGGAEVHLHRIFGKLAELGHPVMLFTTSYKTNSQLTPAPQRETIDGIEVVRCGGDLLFPLNCILRVPRLIKEFKPDIIVEDLNKLPLFSPWITKTPKLIQILHLWKSSIFKEASFPVAFGVWLGERLIPFIYKNCLFAAISPSAKNELGELGISKERVSVIYCGMESEYLEMEKVRDKSLYFLWLGRFRKYKGVWVALKAFKIFAKKHSNVRLIFAGSGPEEAKMRAKIKEWNLEDRVEILGKVGEKEKMELMGRALCLLQTSYKEGWGLTVIEAGACGTASVASNVSGLCDSVKDRETGLLFKAGCAKDCAKKMVEVYTNADLRNNLETAAKTWASSFSWETAAKETLFLMQKIVSEELISPKT